MVAFDRYAFELSQFESSGQNSQSPRERPIWSLIWPDETLTEKQKEKLSPRQLHAELHDRLATPLYPLVFTLVVYAYLGAPRTTRQSRAMSLFATIGAVAMLRFLGFATTVMAVNSPAIVALNYLVLAAAAGLSIWAIGRGIIIEPPAFISNFVSMLQERFAPRPA